MCVILERKPGQAIHPDVIEACYTTNPHGFGIAWYDGTKVRITKGVKSLSEIQALVKGLANYLSLIHFRWATIGEKIKDNCHPFHVGVYGAAMVHNGGFPTRPRKTKDKEGKEIQWSDTKEIGHILNSWSEDIIRRSLSKFNEWHGQGNRTAFLMSNGEILKTGSWSEHEGMTCSNLNWKVRNYRKVQTTGYTVNGKLHSARESDDIDESLYGIYGGNTHRTAGNTKYGPTAKHGQSELRLAEDGPNVMIKIGNTWMSRKQIEEEDRKKKVTHMTTTVSGAYYASNCTSENHQKTDSAQSVNSNTETNQANGQDGTKSRILIESGDNVIKNKLAEDHFKVVINVTSNKTVSGNETRQTYLVYYWDFERKNVRCEYCNEDLDKEIAVWKRTGMTIHLTEFFGGRGKQRIISPDRILASQA